MEILPFNTLSISYFKSDFEINWNSFVGWVCINNFSLKAYFGDTFKRKASFWKGESQEKCQSGPNQKIPSQISIDYHDLIVSYFLEYYRSRSYSTDIWFLHQSIRRLPVPGCTDTNGYHAKNISQVNQWPT